MGVIWAKFRKEKTTTEILENLETKIRDIENFSISTQEKQKRFVGNFLVVSVGLYVIISILFFFLFFPPTWSKRIIYSMPILFFPVLIIFIKRLVAYFFQRKLNRNANQLKTLRAEKKKIIEQVMEKETYKVAIEILNRFADPTIKAQYQPVPTSNAPRASIGGLNQSLMATPQRPDQRPANAAGFSPTSRPQLIQRTPMSQRGPMNQSLMLRNPSIVSPMPASSQLIRKVSVDPQFMRQTPYPIINQDQKSLFEKIVDYLIGEGPSSRYGMICKECFGHNGMVSHDEYEYSAFKCAFCKALNPAKKLRPVAPRLALPAKPDNQSLHRPVQAIRNEENSSSASASDREKESGSDSEVISVIENTFREPSITVAKDEEKTSEIVATNSETAAIESQEEIITDERSDEPKAEIEKKTE